MKHIQKGRCPHEYSRWCGGVAGTAKSDWREVPTNVKELLLQAMLDEQGAICAYTMRGIDKETSHVEHIKPQSLCRADKLGADLEYANLVACFPRHGMAKSYRYGAQKKDNWWVDKGAAFVSPLHPSCEQRFRFSLDGKITAVNGHVGARTTIGVLGLDHKSLTEDRKRVIEEFIYGPTGDKPMSSSSAKRAREIICHRSRTGSFREFCVAIRDALDGHVNALVKLNNRKKAVARNRRNVR